MGTTTPMHHHHSNDAGTTPRGTRPHRLTNNNKDGKCSTSTIVLAALSTFTKRQAKTLSYDRKQTSRLNRTPSVRAPYTSRFERNTIYSIFPQIKAARHRSHVYFGFPCDSYSYKTASSGRQHIITKNASSSPYHSSSDSSIDKEKKTNSIPSPPPAASSIAATNNDRSNLNENETRKETYIDTIREKAREIREKYDKLSENLDESLSDNSKGSRKNNEKNSGGDMDTNVIFVDEVEAGSHLSTEVETIIYICFERTT